MAHTWHFFRAGNVDQVSLRSGADLLALPELDQKLWMVLAMPTRDIAVDPATLDLLDGDGDGRIRVPDILDAVRWIGSTWASADTVLKGSATLSLGSLKSAALVTAARRVLSLHGKSTDPAQSLTVDDATSVMKKFADAPLNGDGVVVPESTTDEDVRAVITEIIAAAGSVQDRSGKPGIDQGKADAFFAAVDARAAWQADGAALDRDDHRAAAAALAAVKAKLDDYFARCQLAELDPRFAAAAGGTEAELAELAAKELSASAPGLARMPIARIAAAGLPLRAGVNPAWADALATFVDTAVKPLLGARERLTAEDYRKLEQTLAPYNAWLAKKPATCVDALSAERVAELARGDQRGRVAKLIAEDKELEPELAAIADVVKAVRFQRDFAKVLRNFVNFSDFYSKRDGAFQNGMLYLDGRGFQLTVPVADGAKHVALASMSAAYLVYCDITRGAEKRQIAAAVTNGDADNIFVGRNGVFYDRAGDDWDATVTKIVSNPISIRQAFWAPYKKLVRLVEEQINKRAADADAKANAKVEGAAATAATVDQKPATPPAQPGQPAQPAKKGLDIGIIAVLSLAISAVVGAIAGMVAMLVGLGAWMPLGVLAVVLAISGPSMLLAWMKLRQRNLGPLLDANGWAVNTRARVNVAFGAALTDLARLPSGTTRSLDDPFADRQRPWKLYAFLVVLLTSGALWYAGKLDRYLPQPAKSVAVLGKHAPANN